MKPIIIPILFCDFNVHEIIQLEKINQLFSLQNVILLCVCVCVFHAHASTSLLTRVQLFATLWTVSHQAPLYMKFSMQEYWSGLSFPTPENLPNQGTNLHLLHLLHCRQIRYHYYHLESPRCNTILCVVLYIKLS